MYRYLCISVLNVNLHCEVVKWCENHQVSLVVVGPEDPLAAGITDSLTKQGALVIFHISLSPYNAELFLFKPWRLRFFFQFEVVIYALVSSFRLI